MKLETLLNKCNSLKSTPIPIVEAPKIIAPSPARSSVPPKEPQDPKPAPRKQQVIVHTRCVAASTLPIRPKPRSRVFSCTKNSGYSESTRVPKEIEPEIRFIKNPQSLSSSSESESDSSSTSDESEDIPLKPPPPEALKPTVKVSNTSTLRNRSITSLKRAIDNDVRKGLSNEIEKVLSEKLQSIGISPEWTGIPQKSYEQAIKIVNHQQKALNKTYPNYVKCRESILLRLKAKVKSMLSSKKANPRPKTLRQVVQKHRNPPTFTSVPSASKAPTQSPVQQASTPSTKTAVQTGKKRVLFDLDTEESSASISSSENRPAPEVLAPPQGISVTATGSTTSVASSVLDEPNKERLTTKEKDQRKRLDEQAKKAAIIEEDISDWDISDILDN